jgi:hypothetical protein
MMSLSMTTLEDDAEDSGATSPVASSLLRVRRARAFATAERCKADTVTETLGPHDKAGDSVPKGVQSCDGFSQSELDSLCVAEELTCCEESMASSHVKLRQEGLDQATLSALSVQDCTESNSDEDGEERLWHLRRCRAFRGHQAAKELVEAEVAGHSQHADEAGGVSQAALDAMCISEDSNSIDVESPDSALRRVRRIRAFLGSSQAQAFSEAEQNKFDLVHDIFGGRQTEAIIDEDDENSVTSTEAILLRTRRMRAFLGKEEADQFAASMRCAEDDMASASSQGSSVCGSPESTGSMLLRIRRTRAFCGRERALALSEEFMADADSHSASVASPSTDVHQISLGEESTLTSNRVNHAVSSTTCSAKSSLCEEDHCAIKVVHGSTCAIIADLDVDAAVGLEMHLSSPTRKLRVMRGGA